MAENKSKDGLQSRKTDARSKTTFSDTVKKTETDKDSTTSGLDALRAISTAEVTINREEYLQSLRDLTNEKNQLQLKNNILHRRLADYYKKRKFDHVLKALDGAVDLEEKYQQKLFVYEELKEKSEIEMADIKSRVEVVENQYKARIEYADTKFDELQNLERTTGTGLIYSKKGKPIADKTVERFLTLQRRKTEQSAALCLRYLRVRNEVADLEAIVKKLETLGPGLYVYQYEQLNVDNQNYTTKIEERDDEIIRNRAKCTEHNQILAHVKEKMHHMDEVIDFTECDLGEAEIEYFRAREDLAIVKTHRNNLRWALQGERQKAGLLTRRDLLLDYQNAIEEVMQLRQYKQELDNQLNKIEEEIREANKKDEETPNLHLEEF